MLRQRVHLPEWERRRNDSILWLSCLRFPLIELKRLIFSLVNCLHKWKYLSGQVRDSKLSTTMQRAKLLAIDWWLGKEVQQFYFVSGILRYFTEFAQRDREFHWDLSTFAIVVWCSIFVAFHCFRSFNSSADFQTVCFRYSAIVDSVWYRTFFSLIYFTRRHEDTLIGSLTHSFLFCVNLKRNRTEHQRSTVGTKDSTNNCVKQCKYLTIDFHTEYSVQ